jgi:hypothetical protein
MPTASDQVFRTVLGRPETTDELVRKLKEKERFSYVNVHITQENFPIFPHRLEVDDIIIHDPGGHLLDKERGLSLLKEDGLLRPTYEHALQFACQHGKIAKMPDKKPFVAFLHKPWRDMSGDEYVMFVACFPCENRKLFLGHLGVFLEYSVLAGISPSA